MYNLIVLLVKGLKMVKIPKSVLNQAKKAVKETGTDLKANKKEVRKAHRSARSAMKQTKKESGEVKWNLTIGDLVIVKKSKNAKDVIGFISKIDSDRARKINDWSQYVEVVSASGKLVVHPKHTKVIQRI